MIGEIRRLAEDIGRDIRIMEVCGGHTNVVMQHGIREILPENICLVSGPGCPVCVTPQEDIDSVIAIARKHHVATYPDMMRVPGTSSTLEKVQAETGNVHEVYSAEEVIGLDKVYPGIIFFGIGFETTAPMTAYLLEKGIAVYSCHRLIPPAMKQIVKGELRIDGFIDPGHVAAVIGEKAFSRISIPQVITGFDPESMLMAIKLILEQVRDGRTGLMNIYGSVVNTDGNQKAKDAINERFRICSSTWRGLGMIEASGLEVKDNRLDAKLIYNGLLECIEPKEDPGCRCSEVLKGLIRPRDCPLFGKSCTPERPKGACMVSSEGSCNTEYRYDG